MVKFKTRKKKELRRKIINKKNKDQIKKKL